MYCSCYFLFELWRHFIEKKSSILMVVYGHELITYDRNIIILKIFWFFLYYLYQTFNILDGFFVFNNIH